MSVQAGRRPLLPRILGATIAALLLSSCSPTRGRFFVLEGSVLASRGMTAEAMGAYMEALPYKAAAPYAEYGLGTLFLALGENAVALKRFSAAEAGLAAYAAAPEGAPGSAAGREHRELLFRIRYNGAVALFLSADYAGAAEGFKRALEVDGSRIEAKRNLELSLGALSRRESAAASSAPMDLRPEAEGAKGLFEYLRQKEGERWKSREESADGDSAADY